MKTPASAAKVIRLQRTTTLLLFLSLLGTVFYARHESRRAAAWRSYGIDLQHRLQVEQQAHTPDTALETTAADSGYYPVTLIGEDGSETPLKGKALHIDLGKKRMVELFLNRQDKGWLTGWAPARRDDGYFHWVIFRPNCANVFTLELERVNTKSAVKSAGSGGATVSYAAPMPLSR